MSVLISAYFSLYVFSARMFDNSVLIYALITLFVISSVLILFILYSRIKLKHTNKLLAEKNREITAQREEIQKQKDHITQKTLDLLVLNKELKENDELRKGLTSMIVHDLKNPISNIINLTDNREVLFFAKQMLTMVENILDIQKYEGMIIPLNKEIVDLRSIAGKAISDIIIFSEYKNIKIENNIPRKTQVEADSEILKRIFVNLLSNAVKYTDKNGKIKIETEPCPDDKDKIKIKVTDNGIGIAKDKIPLIFNKFSQIIVKKTGEARSTGIGLTFCKMAVEAHESSITVVSETGNFTSFEFCLKVSDDNKTFMTETETRNDNDETIVLDEADKEYLLKYYDKLDKLEVFEIGELRKIMKETDETFSENVRKWKEKMNFAIYHCNEEIYRQLKNCIKK